MKDCGDVSKSRQSLHELHQVDANHLEEADDSIVHTCPYQGGPTACCLNLTLRQSDLLQGGEEQIRRANMRDAIRASLGT